MPSSLFCLLLLRLVINNEWKREDGHKKKRVKETPEKKNTFEKVFLGFQNFQKKIYISFSDLFLSSFDKNF